MSLNPLAKKSADRRRFLWWAWSGASLTLTGQASAALLRFLQPRIEPGEFGGLVVAGQLDEFEPGTVSLVRAGRFYIARTEDGGLLALWQRCTHLGCTVPWREDEEHFNCPCHSTIFDAVGNVVSGPAPRPMDIFPIEVVDGQVLVDTSRPTARRGFDPSQLTRV